MSVKIMGLVWDLNNDEIDREEKYVLLAYSDHADHKGYNIFPAVSTIAEKTGYKERAIQLITRSLERKGYLIKDGKGIRGTNKWRVPLDSEGVKIAPVKIAGVQKEDSRGAKSKGEGVQPNAPEPSLTEIQPSVNTGASAKPATPPEIKLFREVTERYPNKINYENVVALIQGVSKRVGHECTAEDLRPFYAAWCANGWNKLNLAWLSYAEHGELPSAQKKNSYQNASEPKAFDGIRQFLEAQNVNAS